MVESCQDGGQDVETPSSGAETRMSDVSNYPIEKGGDLFRRSPVQTTKPKVNDYSALRKVVRRRRQSLLLPWNRVRSRRAT